MAWYQNDQSRLNATKKCPICGRQIPVGNVGECPFSLKSQINTTLKHKIKETEKECPKCKTINEKNVVNCSSCGLNFAAFKQTDSLDMSVLYSAKKTKNK